MKKSILLMCLVVFPLMITPSSSQGAELEPWSAIEIQDSVILPFFTALKNGDIGEIKRYFSKPMVEENKRLLEENTEYPEFLRSYYEGADFSILRSSEVDGAVEFEVLISFSDGSQSISKLSVVEEASGAATNPDNNRWRIGSMESLR